MIYIELGGQNNESQFSLNNMIIRGVNFDEIGESYYPKWHGTLQEFECNVTVLKKKYNKPVIIADYSQLKTDVNKIAFRLPGENLKGTFVWEPLNTWESVFDKDGESNQFIGLNDTIGKLYNISR